MTAGTWGSWNYIWHTGNFTKATIEDLLTGSITSHTHDYSVSTHNHDLVYLGISANAVSATKLATARAINGVNFDGSAPITVTANTPNTLTRSTGLTGSNFNGSAATTWAIDASYASFTNYYTKTDINAFGIGLTTTNNVASFDNQSLAGGLYSSETTTTGSAMGGSSGSLINVRSAVSGGAVAQLWMAANNNLDDRIFIRHCTNAGVFTSWKEFYHTGNFSPANYLPLIGGTLSGDLTVGATNRTANTIIKALAGDAYNAGFEAHGSNQGTGYVYVGQSSQYGGGMFYNGDLTPSFATGEGVDRISFYRTDNFTKTTVFSYGYGSNDVSFRGNIAYNGVLINDSITSDVPQAASRSPGTKIVLYPQTSSTEYALGVESSNIWYSVPGGCGFKWYTSSVNTMSLNGAGVLGIGVTPSSAWSSTYKVLQIGHAGALWSHGSGGNHIWLTSGLYYDGAWRQLGSNSSGSYIQQVGGVTSFNSTVGTGAGTVITPTTNMEISSTGVTIPAALTVGATTKSSKYTMNTSVGVCTVAESYSSAGVNYVQIGGAASSEVSYVTNISARSSGNAYDTTCISCYGSSIYTLANGRINLYQPTYALASFIFYNDCRPVYTANSVIINNDEALSFTTNLTVLSPRYKVKAAGTGSATATRIRLNVAGYDGQEVIITRVSIPAITLSYIEYGVIADWANTVIVYNLTGLNSARFIYDSTLGGWTLC